MYYTYILESLFDGTYYIGYSSDPEKRLEKHNNSTSGYTSRKKPWKLVYTEGFKSKTEAIKRERFIKAQKSRVFIEKLINESNQSSQTT